MTDGSRMMMSGEDLSKAFLPLHLALLPFLHQAKIMMNLQYLS
jgi:hypothetical protein